MDTLDPPSIRALIVAVDVPRLRVQGSVDIARAVADHLHATIGIARDRIASLYDEQATRRAIRRALVRLVEESEPGEQLLFYYRGHATSLPGREDASTREQVLCPADFDARRRSGVTVGLLREVADSLPDDRTMTVLVDADHVVRCISPPLDVSWPVVPRTTEPAPSSQGIAATMSFWGLRIAIPHEALQALAIALDVERSVGAALAADAGVTAPWHGHVAQYVASNLPELRALDAGRGVQICMQWLVPGVFVPAAAD